MILSAMVNLNSLIALSFFNPIVVVPNETRIAFCAASIKSEHGSFFQTSASHLFTCRLDGSDLHQLTTGSNNDSDPSFDSGAKVIRFIRRSKFDLVNSSFMGQVRPDGSGFILEKLPDETDRKARSDREERSEDLPGIPSQEGGVSSPIDEARLGDGTFIFGFYSDSPSLMGIAKLGDKKLKKLSLFVKQHGRKVPIEVFKGGRVASEAGGRAYWYAGKKDQILLQQVSTDYQGGEPHLYHIDLKTGEVLAERHGEFLEDASVKSPSYLTTSWNWGRWSAPIGEDRITRVSPL